MLIFAENNSKYICQNTPKTKERIKTTIIDDILIQILKEWKIKQLEIRIQYGTQNKKDNLDFVFTKYNPTNNIEIPVLPKNIQTIFYRINKHKLLKKMIHPHIIRHTYASLLAEAGIPLDVIQERFGHSSDITRKIHLHITEKEKLNVAKIFLNICKKFNNGYKKAKNLIILIYKAVYNKLYKQSRYLCVKCQIDGELLFERKVITCDTDVASRCYMKKYFSYVATQY